MLGLFSPVRELLQGESVRVDNIVFRLHSRATVLFLSVCAILLTARQYFGAPIDCIVDPHSAITKGSMESYCWIFGTFTISRHLFGMLGTQIVSPGVGTPSRDDEMQYHYYYQWVYFVLILQAILFYVPRALWTIWEGGIVGHLAKDLALPFYHDAWTKERKNQLIEYFTVTAIYSHNIYAIRFLICELLNFINVIGQMYLLNIFLEGKFTTYGLAVATFSFGPKPFARVDPMAQLFPKVAKCTMHKMGPSGSIQKLDAMCVLPLNVVNEKIFVFIWFWLMFLAFVSFIAILYRIIVFTQPWARNFLLRAVARVLPKTKSAILVEKLHFGDWFLLHQLAHNINPIVYRELLNDIAVALCEKCVL